MSFPNSHTTRSLCAITALLVRGMELMEAYTHSYPCIACIVPRKAVAEVSLTKPKTASSNKGSGGRKRKEQSTLVTQSSGQAPLETQHFGRTTALQKGPGKIRPANLWLISLDCPATMHDADVITTRLRGPVLPVQRRAPTC